MVLAEWVLILGIMGNDPHAEIIGRYGTEAQCQEAGKRVIRALARRELLDIRDHSVPPQSVPAVNLENARDVLTPECRREL
ncbi:hypothetical protein D9M68_729950 [compost metagenome]